MQLSEFPTMTSGIVCCHRKSSGWIAVIGKLNDVNLESTTAITMKANLSLLPLHCLLGLPHLKYFNYGVILEGRRISIKFLRKLRLFDCIS